LAGSCLVAQTRSSEELARRRVPSSNHLAIRHSQGRHPIENLASDCGLDSLRGQASGPHRWTEDVVVAEAGGLDLAPFAVAGCRVPRSFPEPSRAEPGRGWCDCARRRRGGSCASPDSSEVCAVAPLERCDRWCRSECEPAPAGWLRRRRPFRALICVSR